MSNATEKPVKPPSKVKEFSVILATVTALFTAVPALVVALDNMGGRDETKEVDKAQVQAMARTYEELINQHNRLRRRHAVLRTKVRMLSIEVYGPEMVIALEAGGHGGGHGGHGGGENRPFAIHAPSPSPTRPMSKETKKALEFVEAGEDVEIEETMPAFEDILRAVQQRGGPSLLDALIPNMEEVEGNDETE